MKACLRQEEKNTAPKNETGFVKKGGDEELAQPGIFVTGSHRQTLCVFFGHTWVKIDCQRQERFGILADKWYNTIQRKITGALPVGQDVDNKTNNERGDERMTKRAIALAGGGSRGAYQMGVWKALREMEIDFQIVTGTSVGALNGALMAQGDYEPAMEMWQNISEEAVIKTDSSADKTNKTKSFAHFMREVVQNGGMDISPLEEIMKTLVNEEKLRSSPIDYALVTVEYPTLKPLELQKKDIPQGQAVDYMLASAACFPAFKAKEIEGTRFIDGGYHDNLPINLAMSMGADEVIAVDLESIGIMRRVLNHKKKVAYIRPYWSLGDFLKFDQDLARRNIALGYLDAKKVLGRAAGWAYAFVPGTERENTKTLFEPMMMFLSKMQLANDKGFALPVNTVLRFQLMRTLQQGRVFLRKNTSESVIMAAAEICGELFDLDPTQEYLFPQFNRLLLNEFLQLGHISDDDISREIKEIRTPADVVKKLKEIDRRHVISFLCFKLEQMMAEQIKAKDLHLLATTLPSEFIAALYLEGLLQARKIKE